jgi:hypothetical protein
MNERLRALANQAGFQYIKDEGIGWAGNYNASLPKFAQLIVQECMACSTWVGRVNTNAIEPVHTAHAINQRIQQHFGVEE